MFVGLGGGRRCGVVVLAGFDREGEEYREEK